jgi:antitoxin (DNA-binding transcriptional repressor) of toxin-antitoxin stability system
VKYDPDWHVIICSDKRTGTDLAVNRPQAMKQRCNCLFHSPRDSRPSRPGRGALLGTACRTVRLTWRGRPSARVNALRQRRRGRGAGLLLRLKLQRHRRQRVASPLWFVAESVSAERARSSGHTSTWDRMWPATALTRRCGLVGRNVRPGGEPRRLPLVLVCGVRRLHERRLPHGGTEAWRVRSRPAAWRNSRWVTTGGEP